MILGSRRLYRTDHVVRRQGPPDPLQLELADRLDYHGVLDLHQHSRTDEDLSGLRLITQPRGDVGHSADSGVTTKFRNTCRTECLRF